MAYRITAADVESVINFDSSIEDLSPFIEAAEELVTEICAPVGYSSDRLAIIEKWLAAHFLAIRDPRYQAETMGQASATYSTQVGLNMGLTPYGQQAQLLDTMGGLARLDKHISQGKRAQAGIVHLGSKSYGAYLSYPWRFFRFFSD